MLGGEKIIVMSAGYIPPHLRQPRIFSREKRGQTKGPIRKRHRYKGKSGEIFISPSHQQKIQKTSDINRVKYQSTIRPINTKEEGQEEMQDWKISEYQANIEESLDSLKEHSQERLDEGRYQTDILNKSTESHGSDEENNNTRKQKFNEDYFTPWSKELENLNIDSSRIKASTRTIKQ